MQSFEPERSGPGNHEKDRQSCGTGSKRAFSAEGRYRHLEAMEHQRNAVARPLTVEEPGSDFLDETIAIWEPRAGRRLTREDAREIVHNLTGFFRVLQEWERAERREAAPKPRRKEDTQRK